MENCIIRCTNLHLHNQIPQKSVGVKNNYMLIQWLKVLVFTI